MKLAAILFIGRVEKNGRFVKDVFRTQWMASGVVCDDESTDPADKAYRVAAWAKQMLVHEAADGVFLLYDVPDEVRRKVTELAVVEAAAANA